MRNRSCTSGTLRRHECPTSSSVRLFAVRRRPVRPEIAPVTDGISTSRGFGLPCARSPATIRCTSSEFITVYSWIVEQAHRREGGRELNHTWNGMCGQILAQGPDKIVHLQIDSVAKLESRPVAQRNEFYGRPAQTRHCHSITRHSFSVPLFDRHHYSNVTRLCSTRAIPTSSRDTTCFTAQFPAAQCSPASRLGRVFPKAAQHSRSFDGILTSQAGYVAVFVEESR